MRNRALTTTVLACFLVWPLLSWAQTPAATPGKVGVINIQEAIASTAEGKKAFADLQKKYQPRQQELQRQQQEITALQDQLQKQATTLSDEERLRLNRELEDKQKVFKRATEDANADFQGDNQDAVRRIGQKMVRLISEYAQQNGFSLVMDDAQIPVYFVAREIDITEDIVKRFDGAYPVATTGTPGTTTPSASPARPAASAPRTPVTPKPADKPKQ